MKKIFLFFSLTLLSLNLFSQTAEEIIGKALNACDEVKNGYFEATVNKKFMDHKSDTSKIVYSCYFDKLEQKSKLWSKLNVKYYDNDTLTNGLIYDGKKITVFFNYDSSATRYKDKYYNYYRGYIDKSNFPNFILNSKDNSLKSVDTLKAKGFKFKLYGEEVINNIDCYKVSTYKDNKFKFSPTLEVINTEKIYYINKKDFLPIKTTESFIIYDKSIKDTVTQVISISITKYDFKNNLPKDIFNTTSIPKYIKLKDFSEKQYKKEMKEREKTIPIGNLAPDWTINTINGEKITLNKLKRNLVLVDFFYKTCPPCMLAIPIIDSLNIKYKDKGLVVIGIDPITKIPIEEYKEFISKKGLSYKISLIERNTIEKEYNIVAFPTIYLIGKDGKILFSHIGYGEDFGKELEKIIEKNL